MGPASGEETLQARRVAALYDIHGNLFALDAVLAELEDLGVDCVVIGGDFTWGPFPKQTVERLRALGERGVFVRGNADREVARGFATADVEQRFVDIAEFCARELGPQVLAWVAALPLTVTIDIDGLGAVLFCHASPRSDEEILSPSASADHLRAATGCSSGVVVLGHTHVQFDHRVNGLRLVNAGSVGLPYEDVGGAFWTLLDGDVRPRRTTYDVDAATAAMRASGCPHVEEVFIDSLVTPVGRAAAMAHLERAAARQAL